MIRDIYYKYIDFPSAAAGSLSNNIGNLWGHERREQSWFGNEE